MNKKYIGVFDSGLGGLTTVKQIIKQMPNEDIVFLADTKHLPYGSKSKEEIISYTLNNIEMLKEYGTKAIVIACNTSDSNAGAYARKHFDLPIFGVTVPAAQRAAKETVNKKVGIIATVSTVASKHYVNLIQEIDPNIEVFQMACEKLVPMIEGGAFINDPKAMKETISLYVGPLIEKGIDTLILGCTHYDLLADMINEMYPDLKLVSSSRCVVDDLDACLKENKAKEKGREAERIYLSTSDPIAFNKIADHLIKGVKFIQRTV